MPDEQITRHTIYRDTYVSLLRDLEVCRELMMRDPMNEKLVGRYYETVCLVFSAATGDVMTHDEAMQVFVRRATKAEVRAAYGT